MLSVLSLVIPILLTPTLPTAGVSTLRSDEPPVRLWLNGDRRFEPGDRARVQVEARDDGFLLVLNYDTDGRVRVLYPVDPRDDGFVRGGRRYEVRDERSRESFVAGREGAGFVYVALSPDPWQLRTWSRGANWDYDQITIDYESDDPERDLTGLLEGISGSRGFDYDLIEYFVHDVEIVRYEYRAPRRYVSGIWAGDPWCDPYWSTGWFCSARTGVVVSYGRSFGGSWWSLGYGPSWYWPYSLGYSYRPYSYGRGFSFLHHRPWVWNSPTFRPLNNRPVIVGRSRDYTTGRLSPWTFAPGDRRGSPAGDRGAERPDTPRSRDGGTVRSRPVRDGAAAAEAGRGRAATDRRTATPPSVGRARPGSGGTGGSSQPSARPTGRRNSDDSRPAARPAPSRQQTAPPRARSRGNEPGDNARAAAASQVTPPRRSAAPARASTARDDTRARVATSRPRSGGAAQAVRPVSRPAAQRPAASRTTPKASSPPRAQSSPKPARASSPPAVSQARRDPPARSRGNQGRSRGNN